MGYYDTVAADSPVAWWPLDDASGSLRELVGGLTGTIVGTAPTYRVAGPLPFVGVQVAALTAVTFTASMSVVTDNYTVEWWGNHNSVATIQHIMGVSGASNYRSFVRLRTDLSPVVFEAGRNNAGATGGAVSVSGTSTIATSRHWAVSVTRSTGAYSFYANGVLLNSGTSTVNPTAADVTSQTGYIIGGWAGDNTAWRSSGTLAHIAYYGSVLSAATIARHYLEGLRHGVAY